MADILPVDCWFVGRYNKYDPCSYTHRDRRLSRLDEYGLYPCRGLYVIRGLEGRSGCVVMLVGVGAYEWCDSVERQVLQLFVVS
jgi:hypothetical protein